MRLILDCGVNYECWALDMEYYLEIMEIYNIKWNINNNIINN